MEIHVKNVWANRDGGLSINLAQPWAASREGDRAMRVVGRHISCGYLSDGNRIDLGYGRDPEGNHISASSVAELNTLAACQAEMDTFANVPMEAQFSKVEVHPYWAENDWPALQKRQELARKLSDVTTMRQLREGHRGGLTFWMQMHVRLNLPAIGHDAGRLKSVLRAGVYDYCNGDPYLIAIHAPLKIDSNPWDIAGEWRTAVRRLVV